MKASDVPVALRELKQWVCWREGSKVPLIPSTLQGASPTNPEHWGTIDQALEQIIRGRATGVGFVFHGGGIVGVDLDHCRNPETGEIEPWAADIVKELDSYTEVSPSGTGLHIIVEGKKPGGLCRRGEVEIYDHDRYFTYTGWHLDGTPREVQRRQVELEQVYREHLQARDAEPNAPVKDQGAGLHDRDLALVKRAGEGKNGPKFLRLWRGDTTEYASCSEATGALLRILAFWTKGDRERMDRLFRSSGLMRDKWDEPRGGQTWGQRELDRIVADKTPPSTAASTDKKRFTSPPYEDLDRTDAGNARRLVNLHGQNLRFLGETGEWFHWHGTHWEVDRRLLVVELAKDSACSFRREAKHEPDPDRVAAMLKWSKTSLSRQRINAALELARSEVAILREHLDRNPWLLSVENGTLDLTTCKLREHRRGDLITRCVPIRYDPNARCPRWIRFLERVLGGDEELVRYVQRAMGYTLTGSTREQCFFELVGPGDNGKSVFVETFRKTTGEYAIQADFRTFIQKKHDSGPRNDIARMHGARLVAASEISRGKYLDEATIKQLTGCDIVAARFLNKEFFDFGPTAKIWMAVNHLPKIKGQDEGIWRRIRIIPFNVRIPEAERDLQLPRRLEKELPGILAWMVEGCRSWQEQGLNDPRAVREAVTAYRQDQDVLGEFLATCCVLDHSARERTTTLYQVYRNLCLQDHEQPISIKEFGSLLADRGLLATKSGGVMVRQGIRLRRAGEEREDGEGQNNGGKGED